MRSQHEETHIRASPSPSSRKRKRGPDLESVEKITGFLYELDERRKYSCPFEGCDAKYIRQYDLERHLKSHSHRADLVDFIVSEEFTSPAGQEQAMV
ncbi:hypothetical protein DFQ28_000197 [Apophysomyces sp. BC1034]|nr:hypothetical protein DFQ29_006606 [Apophysomyces sp. BC1021]KAG0191426.1 hypothetical protein DFQ28_000197 [Apophysomyces sp. BC1034]